MVAFGGLVKARPKRVYGLDLPVLACKLLKGGTRLAVPVPGANHPSFIYNAVKRMTDDPNTPEDERVLKAMQII